jgi:hypothetical protein
VIYFQHLDLDLTVTVKRRGELTGLGFPAGHRRRGPALDVNDGELPGVGDGEEVSDGVQERSAISEGSSGCSIASSRRGERRLEKARTMVCFGRG